MNTTTETQNLKALSLDWVEKAGDQKYTYNFSWMGRPIIQLPQDIVAMQELIFRIQPSVIVETGIAHGGSLIMYASMLELLGGDREVIGVDIDIRAHNRAAIEAHPMKKRIHMIQGSSIAPEIVKQVHDRVAGRGPVLVTLDSNHTHDHVLEELKAYAPLVTAGSYCVVFDTLIEELPDRCFPDRPWKKGNSPLSAVREYLKASDTGFEVDSELESKLLITACPGGWLRKK
ncbi:MAG: cephalosporin hydroxylase family protein [Myxococcaceae bacterium]|nr:cephalosporin hydroxylase family protein [Myxococcaceae bacterium]